MGTWGLGVALGLGVGLGDNPLGFGGWDMGTWVGLWGQPFRFWGLGHGNLGFRGGGLGTTLYRFWGLGHGKGLGVGLGV